MNVACIRLSLLCIVASTTVACMRAAPPRHVRTARSAISGRSFDSPSFLVRTRGRGRPLNTQDVPRSLATSSAMSVIGSSLRSDDIVELRNGRTILVGDYLRALRSLDEKVQGGLKRMRSAPRRLRASEATERALRGQLTADRGSRALRSPVVLPSGGPVLNPLEASLNGDWSFGHNDTFGSRLWVSVGAAPGPRPGCGVSLGLSATAFRTTFSLLEGNASVRADGNRGLASASVGLLGAPPIIVKQSEGDVSWSRSYSTPESSFKIPIWGPVGVQVGAAINATVSIGGHLWWDARDGGCRVKVTPSVDASVTVKAVPSIDSGLLDDLLRSIVDVGVEANLTVASVQLPLEAMVSPRGGRDSVVARADLKAVFLRGQVRAYVEIPDIFFLFDGGLFEVTLLDWNGTNMERPLVALGGERTESN
jgi:hypothetical protein